MATEADGSRYEGEWAEDLRSGEGTATDVAAGWRYTGQWLRGRRVGQGQLVGPAEREYTGGFDEQALTLTPRLRLSTHTMPPHPHPGLGRNSSSVMRWLRWAESALRDTVGMHTAEALRGGRVRSMAYDQRYAQSEVWRGYGYLLHLPLDRAQARALIQVKMKYSFAENGTASLASHNGNSEHVSEVAVPTAAWIGRMRARLEFARRCRSGEIDI